MSNGDTDRRARALQVHDADSGVTVNVAQHIGSSMRLESVQELRLSLLRHWSLLEAMENSAYVATRLGLWNQRGRDNLRSWLCRMGFPLAQCRQLYEYMKPEIREGLHEKMARAPPPRRPLPALHCRPAAPGAALPPALAPHPRPRLALPRCSSGLSTA